MYIIRNDPHPQLNNNESTKALNIWAQPVRKGQWYDRLNYRVVLNINNNVVVDVAKNVPRKTHLSTIQDFGLGYTYTLYLYDHNNNPFNF